MTNSARSQKISILNAAVIVAALGYFVDIYDLLLFSIVRIPSLKDIGFAGRELEFGATLNNIQMTGLMIGGIIWGVLADRKGRLSVLFGSIFLYSVANLLNGYAGTFTEYAFCRFFAGLGLAGELGAGITLVSEVLPAGLRGYGTMLVATVGVSGAVFGGWIAQTFDWRLAFKIGGLLGFLLLLLRISVAESHIFEQVSQSKVSRGNFLQLFTSKSRFTRFIYCILAGVPIWYVIGILIVNAPEFARSLGIADAVSGAKAVMYAYGGFIFGDFASGFLSQLMKSRNRVLRIFIVLNLITSFYYLFGLQGVSANYLYGICFTLGVTAGYWAVIISMAAEQFGTNMRGVVTTSVPNFIRFSLVPMNFFFLMAKGSFGLSTSALVIGVVVSLIAIFSAFQLKETFGRDLGFLEHHE